MPNLRLPQTTSTTRVRSLLALSVMAIFSISSFPRFVSADPPSPPEALAPGSGIRCAVSYTTLHISPQETTKRLGTIKKGRTATIVARSGEWIKIRLATGTTGWIRAAHAESAPVEALPRQRFVRGVDLRPTAAAAPAATPNRDAKEKRVAVATSRGENIVRTAMSYRGTPYRFGASGRGAFDCSGFTKYLFSTEGTALPRTAAQQYKSLPPIPRDQIQPGDLVFFKNTYKRGVSHVGVYAGNGKFVHAASSSRGVRVDSLNDPYYVKKWAGARRPR